MAAVLKAVIDEQALQPPRSSADVNLDLSDWELFRRHCLDPDYRLLGDMWCDVTRSRIGSGIPG